MHGLIAHTDSGIVVEDYRGVYLDEPVDHKC